MARYIDADKLLEELQEELDFKTPMYTGEQNEFFDRGLKCAIGDVKRQPTADVVEVKHGYIIEHQGTEDDYCCECSVCGTHEVSLGDKYCSECGAKLNEDYGNFK